MEIILTGILILGLGFCAGSLVNYLSDVLPLTRRLSTPICLTCGEKQSWGDFLFKLKRYPRCEHPRKLRVAIVLMIMIALLACMVYAPPEKLGAIAGYILLIYFMVVVVIDMEYRLILHPVSLVGAVLAGAIGLWRHGVLSTLLGGVAGFGIMLGFYLLGELFARWLRSRRGLPPEEVALGFGDVNLAGILGLLLGWPGITAGLILAILLGGAGSLLYILWMVIRRRYQSMAAIPYGPFMVLAAVILLYL
jgi:leader peptidase (prepilin peptidase) / N-methyltransferase